MEVSNNMETNNTIGVLFADRANSGLTHDYFAGILDSFKRTVEERGTGEYAWFFRCCDCMYRISGC